MAVLLITKPEKECNMADFTSIGLDPNLTSLNSPANSGSPAMTGFEFRTAYERGLIKPFHAGTLHNISNTGTISPFIVGSTGSGSDTLVVSSTLSNVNTNVRLFAIEEMAFYESSAVTGTGAIQGVSSTILSGKYTVSSYNHWGDTNNHNLVAKNILKNNGATNETVIYRNQWRYLIPPGDAK